MRFQIEQVFAGPVEAVARVYTEPRFYERLGDLPKLGRPAVLDRRANGSEVHLAVRFRFTGHLSSAVRKVVVQGTAIDRKMVGRVSVRKMNSHQLQTMATARPKATAGRTDLVVQRGRNIPTKNIAARGPTNMLKNLGIMSTSDKWYRTYRKATP